MNNDIPGLDAYEREQERYENGLERMQDEVFDAVLRGLDCGLSVETAYEEATDALRSALGGYPNN